MTDGAGWAEVAGGRLPYEVAGSGSGVVLAHAGIADMRQWDPQWPVLTARDHSHDSPAAKRRSPSAFRAG